MSVMPSPWTGSTPLIISSSRVVWLNDQFDIDFDSLSTWERREFTSLVRDLTLSVWSASWDESCLRTSLRGSVLS